MLPQQPDKMLAYQLCTPHQISTIVNVYMNDILLASVQRFMYIIYVPWVISN